VVWAVGKGGLFSWMIPSGLGHCMPSAHEPVKLGRRGFDANLSRILQGGARSDFFINKKIK
jgi:hypothetical protein